jgi:dehydrogenase/reductase SDR family protein 1
MQMLKGKVAVVTGASRGVGKGIALGLGEAGATVYVTGRTVAQGTAAFPGTIGETADAVTRLGGRGVPVRCDHRDDAQVQELFARVSDDEGRLDLLVNNAFSLPTGVVPIGPFWELPVEMWDHAHTVGFRSHYVGARLAVPLMLERRHGLIINISSEGAVRYFFNAAYHAAKAGLDKLSCDMAYELRPHGIAVVSLWPQLTLTEQVAALPQLYDHRKASSPIYNGRIVAALAADPEVMHKSGRVLGVFELAGEYRVSDGEQSLAA